MKFCPECGKQKTANSQSCSCNVGFNSKGIHNQANTHRFNHNDISINEFNNKLSLKKKNRTNIALTISILVIIGYCLALFINLDYDTIMTFSVSYGIVPSGFVIFIAASLLMWAAGTQLNSSEYRALPDALNQHGEHQCLFCGGRGIYKSTIYRTNTVLCKCSKCKKHLFNE
jgi:hypothetical protein